MSSEFSSPDRRQMRPRGKGCSPVVLIVGCVLAFLLFQSIRGRFAEQQQPELKDGPSGADLPVETSRPVPRQPSAEQESDWSIEEMETKPSTDSDSDVTLTIPKSSRSAADQAKPKRTTKGDWSIEELNANDAAESP